MGRRTVKNYSGFQISEQAPRYYESMVQLFMQPFVRAMVDAVVKKEDAVLDVACGTGFAARAASVATGSSGRVVGSDINPGMIAMAISVPHEEGCNISWKQASALELPFTDAEFDVVLCQQGIQFFPDSAAGLREMARVVKPGGRLAATVWAARDQSPYLDAVFGMLTQHCGSDPIANARAYANDGAEQIQNWFKTAGMGSVSIDLIEAVVPLPPIARYLPEHLKGLPPLSLGNYFDLSPERQHQLQQSIDERLDEYRTDQGVEVPFRSYLIVTEI